MVMTARAMHVVKSMSNDSRTGIQGRTQNVFKEVRLEIKNTGPDEKPSCSDGFSFGPVVLFSSLLSLKACRCFCCPVVFFQPCYFLSFSSPALYTAPATQLATERRGTQRRRPTCINNH